MKNMIEAPSEKDFYKTTSVELTQDHSGLFQIKYKKINIAMKSITDFASVENEIEVLDEEKMPEFRKALEEFNEKCKAISTNQEKPFLVGGGLGDARPETPTKTVKITGTVVSYFSTAQRVIVDDFEEFEEKYFAYLKLSRLDLGIKED